MDQGQRIFLNDLERLVRRHIAILEAMFGKCDGRFFFGSIEKAPKDDDTPRTFFPWDGPFPFSLVSDRSRVDIRVNRQVCERQEYGRAGWQIAHECVHLLDPSRSGNESNLEEGLAVWYQDEPQFHDDLVRAFIELGTRSPPYARARDLIRSCLPGIVPAVRRIRSEGIRIGDITPSILSRHLPGVDSATLNLLCKPFPREASSNPPAATSEESRRASTVDQPVAVTWAICIDLTGEGDPPPWSELAASAEEAGVTSNTAHTQVSRFLAWHRAGRRPDGVPRGMR